jgi:hypothetical protein
MRTQRELHTTFAPIVLAVVVVALTATLAGCVAEEPSVIRTENGNFALVAARSTEGGPDALLEGTLEWSSAGCLVLAHELGESLLMMPAGTIIDDETIILTDGTKTTIGDQVAWGGGFFSSLRDDGTPVSALDDLPEDCATDEIGIINSFG